MADLAMADYNKQLLVPRFQVYMPPQKRLHRVAAATDYIKYLGHGGRSGE